MTRQKILGAAVAVAVLVAGAVVFVQTRGPSDVLIGSLRVSPAEVSFGEEDQERELRLANEAPGAASFEIQTPAWLAAAPAGGQVERGRPVIVRLRPDRRGLEGRSVRSSLTLLSGADRGTVVVSLEVGDLPAPAGPPRLEATPLVDLGERADAADIRIANPGTGAVSWRAEPGAGWFAISPRAGSLPPGAGAVVRVTVDRAELAPAPYRSAVSFRWSGGDAETQVQLVQRAVPLLVVPRPLLRFPTRKTGTETLSATIRNDGHAALRYTASVHDPFLRLEGGTGSIAPGRSTALRVTYDYDEAVLGERRGAIELTSDGGSASITVIGYTDVTGPKADDPTMRIVHQHCAASCQTFRHARATVRDDRAGVASVEIRFQMCKMVGTTPTCEGFERAPMRRVAGDTWQAEVGPWPSCGTPGVDDWFANWRIRAVDKVGNLLFTPGTVTYYTQRHCRNP